MDLSALIFVALAVAWAVYLIPKALKQHEDSANSRSIETFSDRMRVVGRREAVSASSAELVAARRPEPRAAGPVEAASADEPAQLTSDPVTSDPVTSAQIRRRRAAAARATERRRRVLSVLALALFTVSVLVIAEVIAPVYLAIPAALLVLWLIACRLMVRREAATLPTQARRPDAPKQAAAAEEPDESTEEIAVVTEASDAAEDAEDEVATDKTPTPQPDGWTPRPATLPTYVSKEPAARTVRTIDLDSTGVWSSGRNAADAELVREAEASDRTQREADAPRRRAAGS